jgi:CheY-like chemotaxis protein
MPDRTSPSPHSILVVDDEPGIRDLMARVLAAEGYRVTAVQDVSEAIAALERFQFDAILADLRMRGGPPGLVLVEEIEGRGLQTPVILMSGSLGELDGSDPRVERLAGMVAKPLCLPTLRSLIPAVIDASL